MADTIQPNATICTPDGAQFDVKAVYNGTGDISVMNDEECVLVFYVSPAHALRLARQLIFAAGVAKDDIEDELRVVLKP
jgi:hypothetical protein